MSGDIECRECRTLLGEYEDAVAELVAASRALAAVAGSIEKDLFHVIWRRCDSARSRCSGLRRLYLIHLERHRR